MQVLVVIDMQEDFKAANIKALRKRVIKEIKEAKRKRHWIFIVEYEDCSKSHDEIYEAIGRYSRVLIIEKDDDDGSYAIKKKVRYSRKFKENITGFRVVGVNTDYCVADTVYGLKEKYPDIPISIIAKGCGNGYRSHRVRDRVKQVRATFDRERFTIVAR